MEDNVNGGEDSGGMSKTSLFVVALIFMVVGLGIVLTLKPQGPRYSDTIIGVTVKSEIPLGDVQGWRDIVLMDSEDKAITSCNFELSAISNLAKKGYRVNVGYGETGITIHRNSADIKGKTSDDILQACHAFACLRDNITCPDNLQQARDVVLNAKTLGVVIDDRLRGAGVRAYPELTGVLGYIQAREALKDIDGDGRVSKEELDENLILIYPYVDNGSTCIAQPFNNLLMEVNITGNETFDCDLLDPSIHLIRSDKNEIKIEDDRITITGGDDEIHTGAVIIRDVLAPEYIREGLYKTEDRSYLFPS